MIRLEFKEPPKPEKPKDKGDAVEAVMFMTELSIWVNDFKEFRKKQQAWENSQTRMFNLTLQHCTPELEDKLKITFGFTDMHLARDAIGLLGLIGDIAHDHTDDKNEVNVVCGERPGSVHVHAGSKANKLRLRQTFQGAGEDSNGT